jgi:hypothetical protein
MSHLINNTMNNTYIGDPLTTISVSNTGTSGQVYTTNGTGGLSWSNLNGTTTSWGTVTADPNLKGASIQVKGDAEFDGEVIIKGKNIADMFAKIEERLAILHPNPELEDKWDELKELAKRYKELEAEIIEKEKVWAILKK